MKSDLSLSIKFVKRAVIVLPLAFMYTSNKTLEQA